MRGPIHISASRAMFCVAGAVHSTVNLNRASRVYAATGSEMFSVQYRLHRMTLNINYGNRNNSGYNKRRIN